MKFLKYVIFLILLDFSSLVLAASGEQWVQEKNHPVIHTSVNAFLAQTSAELIPVWIFFTDKGIHSWQAMDKAVATIQLPERTLLRRAKMQADPQVEFADIQVYSAYIDTLVSLGLQKRHTSNWLNAVSGYLPRNKLANVVAYPFVLEIRLLPYKRTSSKITPESGDTGRNLRENHLLNYGSSETQLEMIYVPALHDFGLTGKNILICLLDTGYDLQHTALQSVNVIAQYDFINNDSLVVDEPGQDNANQDDHGTKVLSTIAGNKAGELYGPAYGASFLLGKTEIKDTETAIEEDNWVACIEWAERLGADIASSSLVYNDWYNFSDMDGNTAITTRIADMAVAHGMVITVSSGNERNSEWYYISAPADADSVITVGAVDKKAILASFSSGGPTADGRIKPDVVAMGKSVLVVNSNSLTDYSYVDGTSFSTPLVAGVCALLLEAHPYWTPMQVREALRQTASRASNPDNNYGWGLVDALAAMHYRCKGDVNGDDIINNDDIDLLAQYIITNVQPDAEIYSSADINEDGQLDIRDIILLLNRFAPLPVK